MAEPEHRLAEAAKQVRLYEEETGDDWREGDDGGLAEALEGDGESLDALAPDVLAWREEAVGETGTLLAAAKMSTEAAEVLDPYIKAEDWPSHEVDEAELEREIGDVLVTLLGVCQEAGLGLGSCGRAAMEKNASDEWREERGL